jgi:hypothetical protein
MASRNQTIISYSVTGTGANAAAEVLEAFGENFVEGFLRDVVAVDLLLGEDGLEAADEVGGADDFLVHGAEELDGAGVDHGDIHDGVARGILHGDAAPGAEHGLEGGFQLLPGGVEALRAGEGVELAGFDAVHELAGVAFGGDDVVPAAADQAVVGEAEDGGGEWVAVMVVVEEPGVDTCFAQGSLD